MRNILFYIMLGAVVCSCEKKQLALYSGPENIYFSTLLYPLTGWGQDSLAVSFTLTNNVQDSLVKIPVQATGKPVDADRAYALSVAPGSTAKEGVHYDFYKKDFIIPAGGLTDSIEVIVHRSPDLKNKEVTLFFELSPNQHFVTNLEAVKRNDGRVANFNQFRLFSSDILQEPASWYFAYLGTFSAKKFYLMLSVLDIDPIKFSGPAFSNVDFAVVQNYGIAMQRYLNSQRAQNKTVYEDDETEMIMGVSAQR